MRPRYSRLVMRTHAPRPHDTLLSSHIPWHPRHPHGTLPLLMNMIASARWIGPNLQGLPTICINRSLFPDDHSCSIHTDHNYPLPSSCCSIHTNHNHSHTCLQGSNCVCSFCLRVVHECTGPGRSPHNLPLSHFWSTES